MWPFTSSSNHYSPHLGVTFEGYYNKFRLPSGASIALIISAVPAAARKAASTLTEEDERERPSDRKAFMVSFTYVSADSDEWWQREYFPEKFDIDLLGDGTGSEGFSTKWDTGEFVWTPASTSDQASTSRVRDGEEKEDRVSWELHTDEISFSAQTTSSSDHDPKRQGRRGRVNERVPWQPDDPTSTPAGVMANFPLPIQWHVHSVDSLSTFRLSINPISEANTTFTSPTSTQIVHPSDTEGRANVHIEKNWAHSFPTSYIWLQARDHQRQTGINLAGGTLIPGVQAYLLGYQGVVNRFTSFKPPTSTSVLGISLGLSSLVDYAKRRIRIDIRGWVKRIIVEAQCPTVKSTERDTFFTFAAPLAKGHQPDYCTQSFAATIKVTVYEKKWWALWMALWPLSSLAVGWTAVEEETFERGSLEFGGGFYTDAHDE